MRVIRASEIGEYVFCHRAWWLRRVQGFDSANVQEMAAGTFAHAAHGLGVWFASALRSLAILLVIAAVVSFLFSLIPAAH